MAERDPIAVLLTVPNLDLKASPGNEIRALARHLPTDEFHLTVCALRRDGEESTRPWLEGLGHDVLVSRFRPRGRSAQALRDWVGDARALGAHGRFDVWHSLDFTSSPLEALVARSHRVPYAFSQRNHGGGSNLTALRVKGTLACRVVSISAGTTRFLGAVGVPTTRIVEIENGLDLDAFDGLTRPADLGDAPYLVTVGHIQPAKRQADVVRAFAEVASSRPGLRLRIVGATYDVGYDRAVRTLAEELGVAARVDLLGSRSDVPAILAGAQVVLQASETEGLPWVVLEAMAAGVAVVSADNEGARDVINSGRDGVLVPVGAPHELAREVGRLLDAPDVRRGLAADGRSTARARFDAARMVRAHADLYRRIARRRSSGAASGGRVPVHRR